MGIALITVLSLHGSNEGHQEYTILQCRLTMQIYVDIIWNFQSFCPLDNVQLHKRFRELLYDGWNVCINSSYSCESTLASLLVQAFSIRIVL